MNVLESSGLPLWAKRLVFIVRVVGYSVLVFSSIYCIYSLLLLYFSFQGHVRMREIFMSLVMLSCGLDRLIFGFAALCLAQLLSYLLDDQKQTGFLLKHADKVLYLWAGIGLISHMTSIYADIMRSDAIGKSYYVLYGAIGLSFFTVLARLLITVIIALVLRRVLPIIEESRSVV